MGALNGLKVVEWSEFISGPYCGKLLADLGAEVVKVEKPGYGDKARSYGPFPQDIPHPEKSGLFLYLNTSKLGATLNVGSTTGAHIFKELMKQADIVIENNSPREVEKLGLNYETLKKLNPRLVMTSITSFGQTGPYRDYKACDLTSFHISGLAFMNPAGGVDDIEQEPPLRGKAYQSDFLAGLSGAIATMSAIFARQATGSGQLVDLSEQEALASMIRRDLGAVTHEGFTRTRIKGAQPSAETVLGQCNDGHFFVVCNTDRFWANWVEVMGNPDWAESELFQDRASRRENWDAAKIMIEEWAKEKTVDEIVRAAQAKRVPCTPVNTIKESVNSGLLADRDYFTEVDHKEAGKVKYPGAPYKLSLTPWHVERPAPLLGEHNEEIYCGRLGYTRQDLVVMRAEGVI
jgi:crotonobetainyl-CoA:carnitine CoA-transferase CaiB-like acyl-CoA transferase